MFKKIVFMVSIATCFIIADEPFGYDADKSHFYGQYAKATWVLEQFECHTREECLEKKWSERKFTKAMEEDPILKQWKQGVLNNDPAARLLLCDLIKIIRKTNKKCSQPTINKQTFLKLFNGKTLTTNLFLTGGSFIATIIASNSNNTPLLIITITLAGAALTKDGYDIYATARSAHSLNKQQENEQLYFFELYKIYYHLESLDKERKYKKLKEKQNT